MPNISIKEINHTSAGTPGEYGNITVLIAGYRGREVAQDDKIKPDFNGAYEFTSQGDFLATIGEAPVEKKNAEGQVVELHYGNRMAKYLLGLGYPVIYKPINSIQEMTLDSFWADFKDKANYDFRFISHGLLETCDDISLHNTLKANLELASANAQKFAAIMASVDKKHLDGSATENDYVEAYDQAKLTGSDGLIYSYAGAKADFTPVDGVIPAIKTAEDALNGHNAEHVTAEVFNRINGQIANLASYIAGDSNSDGRGDCVALIELDENEYCTVAAANKPETLIKDGIAKMSSSIATNGKYCAMTVPSVYCLMGGNEPEKLPGAFYYLACFINSLKSGFAEWYAAAGYTRGVSSCTIDHTSVRLGEIAINTLEPRTNETGLNFACNVIAHFRGSYYLWGNRTAAQLKSEGLTADHFLNIRQLCTTIKKQLYVSCRRFTFDPNSDTLWYNFVNAITPTLERMKADQGIRDYKIIKVYTDVKATLKAKIRIIPIEAVEDFDIEISLEDNFGETSMTANG